MLVLMPKGPTTIQARRLPPAWLELALYLGADFDPTKMGGDDAELTAEWERLNPDLPRTFYESSQQYLYHLTAYFLEGWKRPAYSWLFHLLSQGPPLSILDYGCGIGSDGLWFMEQNLTVNFADYDTPSRRYLAWRLQHRYGYQATIYDVDQPIPLHSIVWCMDVLEHLPPSEHVAFLEHLTTLGEVVLMNLVVDTTADGRVHYPVDADGLTEYVAARWNYRMADCYPHVNGSKVRFLLYGPALVVEEPIPVDEPQEVACR